MRMASLVHELEMLKQLSSEYLHNPYGVCFTHNTLETLRSVWRWPAPEKQASDSDQLPRCVMQLTLSKERTWRICDHIVCSCCPHCERGPMFCDCTVNPMFEFLLTCNRIGRHGMLSDDE